ncbi:maltokinase N-terminal cap-like domain-containing protein [Roseisolibacter agri]|uniref:Maltokinase n=1 Tax=Roseisolibacter agri TaxID=2014610 RepID=A0AA37QB50_9BACT|nr:hypothetical protein [Roseisolibacter agri]GLC28072.1 hypothetical protein rosag_45850 [Roseisolibacter agri]
MSPAHAGAPDAGVPPFDWGALPPAALADHLARQRWSGARGATITDVRVAGWIPFPLDAADACAIVLVEGRVNGAPVRWQLPLLAPSDAAVDLASADATAHAPFRDALRAALAAERELPGRTTDGRPLRWRARAVARDGALAASLPSRVGGAEQSNTSLLYGEAAIVKLFRRLERGPQPDVEIGRALATTRFAHVPALLAVVELDEDGDVTVLAMAQALVPRARDAWEVVVARARAALAGDASTESDAGVAEARRLGEATRRLHDALAAVGEEAFAPEPATPADVRGWAGDAARAFDLALDAVAPPPGEDASTDTARAFAEARAALGALAARREELRARLDALVARVDDDAGLRIRHHGDYHLGQVLRGEDGTLAVIDFEGEPARPLAERRARHSPLRDVAGMLRSFGYAAAAALREVSAEDDVAPRADAWEAAARAAYLDGYFHAAAEGRPSYLPRSRVSADALVRVFELEKLFYELRYEVRNRPDWLAIPLRGLQALLAAEVR